MVSFRRFSRGDVLDSEGTVAEDQRPSKRSVGELTKEDPKTNVESHELSEVVGVDTEGKPRVNDHVRVMEKNGDARPARTGVVEGRAIRVSNCSARGGRGDEVVMLRNGGTELAELRRLKSREGLTKWSVERTSEVANTLAEPDARPFTASGARGEAKLPDGEPSKVRHCGRRSIPVERNLLAEGGEGQEEEERKERGSKRRESERGRQ